jgi:hypothetical protein
MDRKRKKGGKDKEEEEEIDEMEKGAMDRINAENDRLALRNVSRCRNLGFSKCLKTTNKQRIVRYLNS